MQEESSLFALSLNEETKSQLSGVAQWARVFAVSGIVLLCIAFARAIYTLYLLSKYDFGQSFLTPARFGMIAGYLLVFVVPAFALIYLLRFSVRLKSALNAEDQASLVNCFKNLKIYFRYVAIVTIILMVIIAISWILKTAALAN